jgi:hypothetical protein
MIIPKGQHYSENNFKRVIVNPSIIKFRWGADESWAQLFDVMPEDRGDVSKLGGVTFIKLDRTQLATYVQETESIVHQDSLRVGINSIRPGIISIFEYSYQNSLRSIKPIWEEIRLTDIEAIELEVEIEADNILNYKFTLHSANLKNLNTKEYNGRRAIIGVNYGDTPKYLGLMLNSPYFGGNQKSPAELKFPMEVTITYSDSREFIQWITKKGNRRHFLVPIFSIIVGLGSILNSPELWWKGFFFCFFLFIISLHHFAVVNPLFKNRDLM